MLLKNKTKKGILGELWARVFLVKHNYYILNCNYFSRYGEIDIVALKGRVIHFVEVKSVSRETLYACQGNYFIGENFNQRKLDRLKKTILLYIYNNNLNPNYYEYQIDLVNVVFIKGKMVPEISCIQNII